MPPPCEYQTSSHWEPTPPTALRKHLGCSKGMWNPRRSCSTLKKRKRIIHYLWQKCNLTRQFVWQVTGELWDTERSSQEACTGLETLGAPSHTVQLQSGQPFTKHFYSIWIETNKNETAPSTQTVRWTRFPNASTHFISQRLYIGLDSVFKWKTNKQI